MSDKLRKILGRLARPAAAFVVSPSFAARRSRADDEDDGCCLRSATPCRRSICPPARAIRSATNGLISHELRQLPVCTVGPAGRALPITFSNKVIITDIDGDQLLFDNTGTGKFNIGLRAFVGTGGPLTGTYADQRHRQVRDVEGRLDGDYRAIATNPPNGALGNVYVGRFDHDPVESLADGGSERRLSGLAESRLPRTRDTSIGRHGHPPSLRCLDVLRSSSLFPRDSRH